MTVNSKRCKPMRCLASAPSSTYVPACWAEIRLTVPALGGSGECVPVVMDGSRWLAGRPSGWDGDVMDRWELCLPACLLACLPCLVVERLVAHIASNLLIPDALSPYLCPLPLLLSFFFIFFLLSVEVDVDPLSIPVRQFLSSLCSSSDVSHVYHSRFHLLHFLSVTL